MQLRNLFNGDLITVFGPVADYYSSHQDWERVISEEEAAELKGQALEAALEDAGLPKSGLADEKRERLVDHSNAQADPATTNSATAPDTNKEN